MQAHNRVAAQPSTWPRAYPATPELRQRDGKRNGAWQEYSCRCTVCHYPM
jgi:hypothetical protein